MTSFRADDQEHLAPTSLLKPIEAVRRDLVLPTWFPPFFDFILVNWNVKEEKCTLFLVWPTINMFFFNKNKQNRLQNGLTCFWTRQKKQDIILKWLQCRIRKRKDLDYVLILWSAGYQSSSNISNDYGVFLGLRSTNWNTGTRLGRSSLYAWAVSDQNLKEKQRKTRGHFFSPNSLNKIYLQPRDVGCLLNALFPARPWEPRP